MRFSIPILFGVVGALVFFVASHTFLAHAEYSVRVAFGAICILVFGFVGGISSTRFY